jgi:ubiquitin carboxyl-terminal hydrolase 36/42
VTCHRGAELRFGHYTSYVRGPSGAWYHADDEDMSPVSLKQVLNENTAYLLSYIRIGDPDQGPGARPTSTKSSPLPSRSINGHANGHTNGDGHVNGNGHGNGNGLSPSAASSPSMKRKRHWSGDDDDEESEAATPIARRSRLPTPPASSGDEYEEEEEEETQERTPVKWTYGGNKKQAINGIQAPRAQNPEALKKSPIDRPSHPGPASPQDSPRRKKDKRKKMKGGPPMPFNQGGGFRNRPGAISGMKGRQAGRANNRGVFRG